MPTLAIVAPDDRPVYESTFPQVYSGKHVVIEQLVLHSSLDMVDEKVLLYTCVWRDLHPLWIQNTNFSIFAPLQQMWETKDMYLKVVDRYNNQSISAYVTPSSTFSISHEQPVSQTKHVCMIC